MMTTTPSGYPDSAPPLPDPDRPERDRDDDEAPETPPTEPPPVPVQDPPDQPGEGPYVVSAWPLSVVGEQPPGRVGCLINQHARAVEERLRPCPPGEDAAGHRLTCWVASASWLLHLVRALPSG
jgi:hypothetical protein